MNYRALAIGHAKSYREQLRKDHQDIRDTERENSAAMDRYYRPRHRHSPDHPNVCPIARDGAHTWTDINTHGVQSCMSCSAGRLTLKRSDPRYEELIASTRPGYRPKP